MDHKGLAIILGGAPKGDSKGASAEDSDDDAKMKLSAMKDFLAAVKQDDPKAALAAYQDLCDMHGSDSSDDDEESDDDSSSYS